MRVTVHLTWLLAVLMAATGAGAWGWHGGEVSGRAEQVATQNSQALAQLTGVLAAHTDLVAKAGAASRQMRAAVAERLSADARSNQEFRDVLKATAGDRLECEFADDVMRQLAGARDRAAQASAAGVRGEVPRAPASAPQPGGR